MPLKQRETSYSGVLWEGSPNIPGAKNPVAANFGTLQASISQLITDFNQLKTNGVDKQDFEKLCSDVQQLTEHRLNTPSKDAFDILLNEVRQIGGKVDTPTQKAMETAQLDDGDDGNDSNGAIDLPESPENNLADNNYHGFPQNLGTILPAKSEQAAQGGAGASQSFGATSHTHTHGSQRTQALATDEQFWVHIKLWEIKWGCDRIHGGQEVMRINVNSTLRDLEIQIENFVKKIQKGDIRKRANLEERNVFYWSTEHVVDNIKAMRGMDDDENMWSSNQGGGTIIINEDNDIGVMDWLKRENQMPWLSVTIKLKDASER
jgi:hypothetical protein